MASSTCEIWGKWEESEGVDQQSGQRPSVRMFVLSKEKGNGLMSVTSKFRGTEGPDWVGLHLE
jgi:hypothetical protein